MSEARQSLFINRVITPIDINMVLAKIPGSNDLPPESFVSLRTFLLAPVLVNAEKQINPSQLVSTEGSIKNAATYLTYIISCVNFALEENIVFNSICKKSEINQYYAKEVYRNSLKWFIIHLPPEIKTSDYSSGVTELARLTASQIYLLSRGELTYEQLIEFRKEALESALTETS